MKKLLIVALTGLLLLSTAGCNSDVRNVEKMIDSIGDIHPTLECKNTLDDVLKAYNALSDDEKKQVSNYEDFSKIELEFTKKEISQRKLVTASFYLKSNAELCKDLCDAYSFPELRDSDTYIQGMDTLKEVNSAIENRMSDLESAINERYPADEIDVEQWESYYLLKNVYNTYYKPLYELTINPSGENRAYKTQYDMFENIYKALEESITSAKAQDKELSDALLAPYTITEAEKERND